MCKAFFLIMSLLFLSAISLPAQRNPRMKGERSEVKVKNLDAVNTSGHEFSPAFYLNGIVFCGDARDNSSGDADSYFELFYADATSEGELARPRSFSATVNSHLNEGPATFSRDGRRMFFTRNNSKGGVQKADAENKSRLKVYEAQKGPYDWEDIRELPFNADEFTCMHPSISEDGNTLYFASDRPGGFGGMDLYRVRRESDRWSEPENLGPRINSEADEAFPFLYQNELLFFSSDRSGSHGGLDLYVAELYRGTSALQLDKPFNSRGDDFGLILQSAGKRGYFTSSRENGRGLDDLFLFETPPEYWGELIKGEQNIELIVIDEHRRRPLEATALRLYADYGAGYQRQEGQLHEKRLVPSEYAEEELIFQTFQRDEAELGPPDALCNSQGKAYVIVQRGVDYLLHAKLKGYQVLEYPFDLELLGGDSVLVLELRREQCIERSGELLETMRYDPLPNGIIKIQSLCLDKPVYLSTDSLGQFTYCFQPDCNYLITGLQEEHESNSIPLSARQLADSLRPILTIALEPKDPGPRDFGTLQKGSVIVLENIYYDFDKSAIRAGDASELDQLAEVMRRYPSMEVQLISHTDSRGNKRYNKVLSEMRSESAREYLVAKGIAPNRITTLGKGESELRNECKDKVPCTEQQHQYNRRTEVVVTRFDEEDKVRFEYEGRGN